MMGYQDIMDSYRFITTNAARTLHVLDRYGIEPGKPGSFIVLDAKNYYEALNFNSPVLLSFKNGNCIRKLHSSECNIVSDR